MKTQKQTQAIGRTLSIDELAQVSGGHNPPGYLVERTVTRETGIPPFILNGISVPPDPYVIGH
uniref:bacteriocin n=1 Tax=Neorhizobium sp. EC2-8 TaxID=3129230 RepID=UPI003101390B